MLSIDCCKLCIRMNIDVAKRVYNVMKTIKYHLLATIRCFAIEGKREQIDSMTFEETHRFYSIIIFSFYISFPIFIVDIYHFIRQFYKKPAGYMWYTFFLSFSLSSKTILFFWFILFELLISTIE
jgi:hypothetical protein